MPPALHLGEGAAESVLVWPELRRRTIGQQRVVSREAFQKRAWLKGRRGIKIDKVNVCTLVDKYDEWMIQMKERSLLRIVRVIFKTLKMKEKRDRWGCSANTKTKRRQSRKKDAIYSFLSRTFIYICSTLDFVTSYVRLLKERNHSNVRAAEILLKELRLVNSRYVQWVCDGGNDCWFWRLLRSEENTFYMFIPPAEITKRLCGWSDLVLTSVLSQFTPVINTYITSTDRHDVFCTKKGRTWCITFAEFTRRPE